MSDVSGTSRRAKLAVWAVSGGLLAMIWSGVWYAAVTSGRGEATPTVLNLCRGIFVTGLVASILGFVYLRRRRLRILDGSSSVHAALPPDSDSGLTPKLEPRRLRV